MSIVVSGLTKQFDNQIAVNDVSFSAKKGEILGFLGPNGAGKTTTMKMICCYLNPSKGTATVNGLDILKQPLQVRQQIGYLPEHNPLYQEMYVKEYLEFVASIHKIENKRKRIEKVIDQTGLGPEQHKIIGTLSKGYRQRVGLAQAIIHDPSVLILDEPTSGLDMNQLVDIRKLITELSQEKTVIFSSHVMQEVEALCSRVVIINNGLLVADESVEILKQQLSGNQTVKISFVEANVSVAKLKNIKHVREVIQVGSNYTVIFENGVEGRPMLFAFAVKEGLTLLEMTSEKTNVEDIFRQLTKSEMYA